MATSKNDSSGPEPQGVVPGRYDSEWIESWNARMRGAGVNMLDVSPEQSPEVMRTLRSMGVPDRLIKFCFHSASGGFQVRISRASDIQPSDLKLLAGLGVDSLIVRGDEPLDLREIAAAIPAFRAIHLLQRRPRNGTSKGPGYTGIEVLATATTLEELEARIEISEDVDLSALPRLHRSYCTGTFALSAAANPRMRDLLVFTNELPDKKFVIRAPLEKLRIRVGENLRDLSVVASPENLRELVISDSNRLDVSSLQNMRRLRRVEFTDCGELIGVETLLSLPALDRVEFVGIRRIRNVEMLMALPASDIRVEGNWAFDEKFQESVGHDRRWSFTPFRSPSSQSRNKPIRVASRRISDDLSFAPFDVSAGGDGSWVVTFDDWRGVPKLLGAKPDDVGANLVEHVMLAIIREDLPLVIERGDLEWDSEGDRVIVRALSLKTAQLVAVAMASAWRNPGRVRRIAHEIARGH